MKSNSGTILGLTLLAGLLTMAPASAEDAPQSCDVPAYLLTSESGLPKVTDAVKGGHSLDILVVGSRSSTINTSDGSAYPGRLQASSAGETAFRHGQPVRRSAGQENRRGSRPRAG